MNKKIFSRAAIVASVIGGIGIVACGPNYVMNSAEYCRRKQGNDPECAAFGGYGGASVQPGGGTSGTTGTGGMSGTTGTAGSGGGGAPIIPACDVSAKPDEGHGVFVAFGASSGDGSRAKPFSALADGVAAITKAAGAKTILYVQESAMPYAVKATLTLVSDVRIEGGWDASWGHDCADAVAGKTVLQGTDASVSPVVDVTAGTVAVTGVTVKTVDKAAATPAADTSGLSLIAMRTTGGTVSVEGATLVAGAAGDGGAASDVSMKDPGAVMCNGVTDCLCDALNQNPYSYDAYNTCISQKPLPQPQAGMAPADGAPGSATFAGTGAFVPGDGVAGTPGMQGGNGMNGQPNGDGLLGLELQCVCVGTPSKCSAFALCAAQTDMTSCTQAMFPGASAPTAANGRCGCGGLGGIAGNPGRGGGSSVALLVVGGSVALGHASLASGKGGKGTAASKAGPGGIPSDGKDGQNCTATEASANTTPNPCSWKESSNPTPKAPGTCIATTTTTTTTTAPETGGAKGSPGAPGSRGGLGGPGAGGPSYAVVTVGTGKVDMGKDVTLTPGQGGIAPPGAPAGEAAAVKHYL